MPDRERRCASVMAGSGYGEPSGERADCRGTDGRPIAPMDAGEHGVWASANLSPYRKSTLGKQSRILSSP
jgi:hypothetical protein